jgi:acyl-CoA dehydrogenase
MTNLEKVAAIGAEVAGPAAASVDREARFPHEAIAALKREKLMSALVPKELGGMGVGMIELCAMCETLGQHCSNTAMVFAMHQIQVACIVRHAASSPYFRDYMKELVEKQFLIASVTSEVGVGGEIRRSICAVELSDGSLKLNKDATTVSYGEHADDLLLTCRRSADAASNDQVMVLARKGDFTLSNVGKWDTMGMRGTCSPPALVSVRGVDAQVIPDFATIISHTKVPFSHILWSGLWSGIAAGAVGRARAFVRQQARANPGTTPPSALRLAEVVSTLQTMRANVHDVAAECEALMNRSDQGTESLTSIGFGLRFNNLKVSTSQLAVQIANQAMLICGINGYKNDSPFSVARHLRDAHSAALMVANDRILATNASILLVLKDG